ncbi:helix-turn-helix domain-containing protein [Leucobacter chromiireducens]|uniref:DNA-binding protein n=1 Tax=Leucobacter chromiireducens subsp. solipictus TaxID=398235 RepID=A0ABS1SHL1_9MICO|nr:helix-turn-helix domain-containing protein [Leucobacter chromiireducens]MBL3679517.1 DNA-binding protein [Leucobacter chromiireducens subsp. solipictus]
MSSYAHLNPKLAEVLLSEHSLEDTGERAAYDLAEAAELLGMSKRALWNLVSEGEVPAIRIGRQKLYVPAAYLDAVRRGDTIALAGFAAQLGPSCESKEVA